MKPTVCAVMLVNGRAAMVKRAIACFRAQTYDPIRRLLLILDTGKTMYELEGSDSENEIHDYQPHLAGLTIGRLRNFANGWTKGMKCDLIAHFDSDDWSHPRRLEEQVALLEANGKQCVGYRECLFWDTRPWEEVIDVSAFVPGTVREHVLHGSRNEAWLYRQDEPRFAIGASMMYRRELWEQQPFPDAPAEDYKWWLTPLVSNNCMGVSSIVPREVWRDGSEPQAWQTQIEDCGEPRIICEIHGGNEECTRPVESTTDRAYDRATMLASGEWKRAAEFDSYCAEKMKL